MTEKINISSKEHTEFIDITSRVQSAVYESGVTSGMCLIYIPHTTAGVTINENSDPDVQRDLIKELEKIVPWNDDFAHFEGNSAAHLKATICGFSELIPIENGKLDMGIWQAIYFAEFDGPRNRNFILKIFGV
ncbi:MAG: secondary thiamine-phosphate synthase enzyme YjbQ [Clostridia bacterium]|nr:secondary thiamine-phosphate synthase enzyme YjbQ [Clostridia bacterium]